MPRISRQPVQLIGAVSDTMVAFTGAFIRPYAWVDGHEVEERTVEDRWHCPRHGRRSTGAGEIDVIADEGQWDEAVTRAQECGGDGVDIDEGRRAPADVRVVLLRAHAAPPEGVAR